MIDIKRFVEVDNVDVGINLKVDSDTSGADKVIKMFDTLEKSSSKYASNIQNNFKSLIGSDATKILENRKKDISNVLSAKHTNTRTNRNAAISDITSKASKELDKVLSSGSSASISNVFNSGKSAASSLNKTLEETVSKTKNVDASMGSLSKTIKASLLVQLQSLYYVLRRTFSWMTQAFVASGDYVESINLYTMSVGEYADAGEKWAEKISDALYLDTSEIYQYTGQFYNLTRGLGATAQAADLMSRNLTQLTYDMSSYLNIDVSVANSKLMSAMSGQTKAVTSVGIAVQAASLQELAYSLGIQKSVQSMTQAEKTYLRYIQIMRTTTQMQGDLGRTIITPTNAIRLLKTQFVLLSRAIGQVLTPVIMEVIPYIMALTQVLTEAAQTLANILGYKIGDYLADASQVTKMSDWFDDVADSADAAAKSINNTLAPFDELNVVSQESKGGSGGVDTGSILGDLEQYLDGYDMLQYYTDKMKKKMEALKGPMKDLLKVVGALLGVKALAGLINQFKKLKTGFDSILGVGKKVLSLFGGLVTKFKDGYKYAKFMGEDGLGAILGGTRNLLTPLQKVALTIGTTFAAFKTGFGNFSEYAEGTRSLASALEDTAVKGGLLVGVAWAFGGPWSALATGIGLVVGAVDGYYTKLNEIKVHEAVFDGQGTKLETLAGYYNNLADESTKYYNGLDTLSDKYMTAKESEDSAKQSLDEFITSLELQGRVADESQLEELSQKYDNLKTSMQEAQASSDNYFIGLIVASAKARGATEEDTATEIANFRAASSAAAGYRQEYIDKEAELTKARYSGKLSVEEYDAQLQTLKETYGLVVSSTVDSAGAVSNFASEFKGIDYGDIESLPETMDTVTKKFNNTIESLEKQKETIQKTNEAELTFYKESIKRLDESKRVQGELTEEQQKIYDSYSQYIQKINNETDTSIATIDDTIKKVQGEYKGFLATVYIDLTKNGADTSKEFSKTMKTLEKSLNGLKDTDMSGTGKELFKSMEESLIGSSDLSMRVKLRDAMKKVGIEGNDAFMKAATPTERMKTEISNKYQDFGKDIMNGSAKGVKKGSKSFLDEMNNAETKSILQTRTTYGIHSPSTVYEGFGKNIVAGLVLGIDEKQDSAKNSIKKLANVMNNEMKNISLSFNSNSFTNSLNGLLDKLQIFANRFRNGVNDLLSGFTSSMNNVKVGSNNKLYYNNMPYVSIPRFEDGGFPTSASLFYANENGAPEMIGRIGNKTAVANNDQITKSITNALMQALSEANLGNNEPRTTIVKIGEKTIYSGIGDYVDSENDRYGTNYIRV